jgi:hypothetical protein
VAQKKNPQRKREMERVLLMVVKTRFINASRCQLCNSRKKKKKKKKQQDQTPPFLFASPLNNGRKRRS